MARIQTIAGHKVEQHTSPNRGGRMSEHRGVVAHIAQGFYRGTIGWQMNPAQRYADGTAVRTCSTWIIGKKPGEIAQMVDTAEIAWCQRAGSRTWLSAELVGFAPDRPTVWQLEAVAHILVWDHQQHGTPLRVAGHDGERGLGHHSMDREWLGTEWGHEACPGTGVIAAKPAMVARALEILGGDDVDEPTLRRVLREEVTAREWDSFVDGRPATLSYELFRAHRTATRALSEVAAARGEVAGLTALVERLLAAPPVPVTAEQLAEMTAVVAAAARAPGDRIAAALAAAGGELTELES